MGHRVSVLALCSLLWACKGSEDKAETAPVVSEATVKTLQDEEQALLAKRDSIFSARSTLAEKRKELANTRLEVVKEGGDVAEVDAKLAALEEEEKELDSREKAFFNKLDSLMRSQRETLAQASVAASGDVTVARREAAMASREKVLAERERLIAQRESQLAERERTMAATWKESCSIAAASQPSTIIKTVDVGGSSYTKKDVEPYLQRARKQMTSKGLLKTDLPNSVQGLEKEATAAMKEGDYGRARLAARQLASSVGTIKIDRSFIAAKIRRLNQKLGGKQPSSKVEALFREATSLYSDAKFSRANGKLNQIDRLL